MSNLPNNAMPVYTPADRQYREDLIRAAAYLRSQQRRPCTEHQAEDWLAAEAQIDAMLTFHPRRT
jgi:hypothetical protein